MNDISDDAKKKAKQVKKSIKREKVVNFFRDNAVPIVLAGGVAALVVISIKERDKTAAVIKDFHDDVHDYLHHVEELYTNQGKAIDACVALGIPFVHYPGVGVRPDNLEDLEKISDYIAQGFNALTHAEESLG